MEMIDILRAAVEANASDIHIYIGKPPMIRTHGQIKSMDGFPPVTSEESKRLIYSILYEEQIQRFEENLELDSSFEVPDIGRFRVNVLVQKNGVESVLRVITTSIPTPSSIGLTDVIVNLTKLNRGLILVTGPTGSGKTTTLASMIEVINGSREEHILTIEDPIEFVFTSKKSIVRQREVGINTRSFSDALRHALRQDPDIILIGEMRDLETISLALTAAETGHLAFATLHTQDAPQTINRIIDVFPAHQQQQVRAQLANTLQAVICQQLLPMANSDKRIAAREVMINTTAIANLIREEKTHQIYSAIEAGMKFGMITMDAHLAQLVKEKKITYEDAVSRSNNPEGLATRARMAGTAHPSYTGTVRR